MLRHSDARRTLTRENGFPNAPVAEHGSAKAKNTTEHWVPYWGQKCGFAILLIGQ